MKTINKKKNRKPVNLYLSKETIEKAQKLAAILRRPSISNVVEILIEDEAARQQAA